MGFLQRRALQPTPSGGAVDGIALPAGVSATSSVGTAVATGDGLVLATGVAAASSLGTAVAHGAGTAVPTGVSATSSVGTAVATGDAVVLAVGVAASSALGTVVATGIIHVGGVTRDALGVAIAGATVEVFRDDTHVRVATATSDGSGLYGVDLDGSLAAVQCWVRASKAGSPFVAGTSITGTPLDLAA